MGATETAVLQTKSRRLSISDLLPPRSTREGAHDLWLALRRPAEAARSTPSRAAWKTWRARGYTDAANLCCRCGLEIGR
eukprot:scaffold184_cov316-Pinguiococcus_pyrenoidosus.AAC.13